MRRHSLGRRNGIGRLLSLVPSGYRNYSEAYVLRRRGGDRPTGSLGLPRFAISSKAPPSSPDHRNADCVSSK